MPKNYIQSDIATYAGLMGHTKYFQKGGVWYGAKEGVWKPYETKEEARVAAGLKPITPTSTPKSTLEGIKAGIEGVAAAIPGVQAEVRALAEVDTSLAPAIETNAGDIDALGAGLIGTDKGMQDLIETLAKQSEEAAKRAAVTQKGILASIAKREEVRETMPSVADVTKTTLAQYGLTPESVQKVQGLIGQLTSYSKQAADLESQKQTAIGAVEQVGMPQTWVLGRQALTERQYNSKISAKAAQAGIVSQEIQMTRGLWDDARAATNMIVSALTYDQQQELADLDWVYNTYQDLYAMATNEEKITWDRAYTLAENELKRQQNDWNTKLALNQRAAEAGVSLGWDSNYMASHTVEELNAEYAKRVAEAVVVEGVEAEVEDIKMLTLADRTVRVDVNNITSATIEQMRSGGMSDADIFSWLDVNAPKLTAGSINRLLAPDESPEGIVEGLLDEGYTREDIINKYEEAGKTVPTPIMAALDKHRPVTEEEAKEKPWWLKSGWGIVKGWWDGIFD